jgi:tetratricopeptide (TPR) repeat protein
MASTTPIVRQINWLSLIPQLIVMAVLSFAWWFYDKRNFILLGTLSYLILSIVLRGVLARQQRKGIQEIRKGNYKAAIPYFEKSYEYFTKNTYLDKWRSLFLLSSSRISYREMALINRAFCYTQIKEGEKAKELYKKALEEFPDSGMAKAGLNMMESLKEK